MVIGVNFPFIFNALLTRSAPSSDTMGCSWGGTSSSQYTSLTVKA